MREYLPVYYDPMRKAPVFGPGAVLTSQAAPTAGSARAGWLTCHDRDEPESTDGRLR